MKYLINLFFVLFVLAPSLCFGWGEVTRPQLKSNIVGYGSDLVGVAGKTGTVTDWLNNKYGRVVDIEAYGAVSNDGITDSTAIAAAYTYAASVGATVYFPEGIWHVNASQIIPVGVNTLGNGDSTRVVPLAGTYTNDFIFLLNTDGTTWIQSYPNVATGFFRGVSFYNSGSIVDIKAIFAAGSWDISDVRSSEFYQTIKTSAEYNDHTKIYRVGCFLAAGTEYQIEIGQLGDGLHISDIHFPKVAGATPNGLKIVGAFGGSINNVVGGNHYFMRCAGISFSGFHGEDCTVEIDGSDITLRDSIIYRGTVVPILLSDTDNVYHAVTLDNVRFGFRVNAAIAVAEFDVQINSKYSVAINDCFRVAVENGNVATWDVGGILLANESGTAFDAFNNYSAIYSRRCDIQRSQIIDSAFSVDTGAGTFTGLSGVSLSSKIAFTSGTNTYYYQASIIYDPVRLIGLNPAGAERSVAVTSGGNGVLISPLVYPRSDKGTLRIWRGTSTGSYAHYVDIPLISSGYVYDSGSYANGYLWQNRTPGGADTYSAMLGFTLGAGKVDAIYTVYPVRGTWKLNDTIFSQTRTIDGNGMLIRGWDRMTAGAGNVEGTDWQRIYVHTSTDTQP